MADRLTPHGFTFGSATITRLASDEKKGWIVLGVTTPKADLQVYITKTGKIRVSDKSTEWKPCSNS